jgi:hypothetical protein
VDSEEDLDLPWPSRPISGDDQDPFPLELTLEHQPVPTTVTTLREDVTMVLPPSIEIGVPLVEVDLLQTPSLLLYDEEIPVWVEREGSFPLEERRRVD